MGLLPLVTMVLHPQAGALGILCDWKVTAGDGPGDTVVVTKPDD